MKKDNKLLEYITSYIMITIGAILASLSLEVFLIPNLIIDGGVTGISIMLSHISSFKLSIFILVLNLPFLAIGFKQIGKDFLFKTAYAMLLYSLLLSVFSHFYEATGDVLLATVFGGVLLGLGVGIVIRYGGCLDGTETIAIVLSKNTHFSVGQVILIINIIIYSFAGYLFGWDRAMYSLLTYFITFKLIDMVAEGLDQAKSAMIITKHSEDISNNIYKKLGRTCTIIEGEGLISGDKQVVLYCVITRMEVLELKHIIKESDTSAFVTISDVAEVIGHHVKKEPIKKK